MGSCLITPLIWMTTYIIHKMTLTLKQENTVFLVALCGNDLYPRTLEWNPDSYGPTAMFDVWLGGKYVLKSAVRTETSWNLEQHYLGFAKHATHLKICHSHQAPPYKKGALLLRMCELLPHVFFYLQHVHPNPFRTRKKDILDLEKDTVLMPDCSELPVSPSAGKALHAKMLSGKWSKGNRHGQNLC